jgi:pyruvate dehydrogenase E1 component alpha subunit
MDVDTVHRAAQEAVDRARNGGGPAFLECRTYRFEGHHTMERRLRLTYRSAEEVAAWRARDPLDRLRPRIAEADRIDAEVAEELRAAAAWALAEPRPDPAEADAYLYATGPRPRSGVPG